MVVVVDYHVGNVLSVLNACKRVGLEADLATHIDKADGIILPGVGAFPVAMENLHKMGLVEQLRKTKKPMLGICLGMQILFEKGYENYACEGLGLLSGTVDLIKTDAKLPHMGWNTLSKTNKDVYFVHSYMAEFNETTIEYAEYAAVKIPAIVGRDHVMGFQFHPEKSGAVGETLLKEWKEKWRL